MSGKQVSGRLATTLAFALICSDSGLHAAGPTPFESEVLAALNTARQMPAALIPVLQAMLPNFHGTMLIREGRPSLVTLEGAPAITAAIEYLQAATPCGALQWNDTLAEAAHDHAVDQGVSGETGHGGSDGSLTDQRVRRYGEWRDRLGENITYGAQTPNDVALDTIIDDGVTDRGHRNTLMECSYRLVGVACGEHPRFRRMCVMVFAAGMNERPALVAPLPNPSPEKGR
ncbi:MAG: CAP domain-containing protein [Acidobacteriota bacterium]